MDELGRILDKGNPRFIPKLKARWESFYGKAQFYGVYKKVMKPPMTLDGGKLPALTIVLFFTFEVE